MKGRRLTVQEVAKLENRSKVYVVRCGYVSLELVAKTLYSNVVRTLVIGAPSDNFEELTETNSYYEYVPGVNVGEIPEITFDTIRFAVATCKHNNDKNKKLGNPAIFPGIDEAYEILNKIAVEGGND